MGQTAAGGNGDVLGNFLFAPPPATDKVTTDLQHRDTLLAQLATLGYPLPVAPPAALPATPPALDWTLAQDRADKAAKVKETDALIHQLRQNIASLEQKNTEDAAATALALAVAQPAVTPTTTTAGSLTPVTAAAEAAAALAIAQTTAATAAVDTRIPDQSLAPPAGVLAPTVAPSADNTANNTAATQADLQAAQAQAQANASLAQDAQDAAEAALTLATTQDRTPAAHANAAATVAAQTATALADATAQVPTLSHTAVVPPAGPSLDPAALTGALQAAAAQTDAAQGSPSSLKSLLLCSACTPAKRPHRPPQSTASASPLFLGSSSKIVSLRLSGSDPPLDPFGPHRTPSSPCVAEDTDWTLPTRALHVRKDGTPEDNVSINVDFMLNILLTYAAQAGTEITQIKSPYRMNEQNLLGPVMPNSLNYYFPTVKDRNDVATLWQAALDDGLTIADFEPVPFCSTALNTEST